MDFSSLISQMTLEEKASLCSGGDAWHTKAIPRLKIPSIMVTDGPHGIRKEYEKKSSIDIEHNEEATCFPTACTTACSFDPDLLFEMGKALGEEAQAKDVSIILGPGVNIKRSPLCGRNFEYFSEDPYLISKLAAGIIKGIQSMGVGACIKHFAANNQEFNRMFVNAIIDDRTLREIYLTGFEGAIKDSQPYSVMCSYNKVNGTFSSENKYLLEDILRSEWGYKGFVMSDWYAVNDRVEGIKAGLELQMPGPAPGNDQLIVDAVKSGKLDEEIVDRCVERILNIVFKCVENKKQMEYNKQEHHDLARKIASESIVLLKNNNNILPLQKTQKIAFIGDFAMNPRYQGSGSSRITPYKISNALDLTKEFTDSVTFSKGYDSEKADEKLIEEAVKAATDADVAVLFIGLLEKDESEGFDKTNINLPESHNVLVEKIAEVNENVVIVLHGGSPVTMPWVDKVNGILETYLGGEAIGEAIVDILFGKVNPSGRLAETFPLRIEHNPSFLDFPGHDGKVIYQERMFVGYRYYDTKKLDVLFPFGYGLSYTTFEYSHLVLSKKSMKDNETVDIEIDVKNTGSLSGKEVIQVYVSDLTNTINRPAKELKGFAKVELKPNETKTVKVTLDKRSFAFYDEELKDWYVPTGEYEILVGKSVNEIILRDKIHIESTTKKIFKVHRNTTIGILLDNPITKEVFLKYMDKYPEMKQQMLALMNTEGFVRKVIDEMPLRNLEMLIEKATVEEVNELIQEANRELEKQ
ncbi:glycosyl hydrolase [Histomonas meleagridis]|uniref:glycosyl hydrolase n=1 Tax=Histomonas meleagridis TaxID=135588 RepID=UPI003559E1F1|nr:glycosyl hydrolase [Histomonas meleagridis]KAH0802069.1 glycosyl hydrolase [Histomonas meleagridis]